MAVMAQASGTYTTPTRFTDFMSAVASVVARSRRQPTAVRSERYHDVDGWRTESFHGASATEAAARFTASGQIW
jgi:hypothetical protein